MKNFSLLLFLVVSSLNLFAQNEKSYVYSVDINRVLDDKLEVELQVPELKDDKLIFHFPKIVPGSYEIADFGRFISGLKAFDKKDKEMKIERVNQNSWKINRSKNLRRITYIVEDTWDSKLDNHVFDPSGSNIEANQNFVFNNQCFFGFFKGYERLPIVIEIDRPLDFYGSTSLNRTGGDLDTDVFRAGNYNELIDAPMMYCYPDTTVFLVGNTRVEVSVYSPNKKVSSKFIADQVFPILDAQRQYLGGILPVNKYNLILYLSPTGYPGGIFGALEHSYSSMFALNEDEPEKIVNIVKDITSHEFFHIVTPLHIHSEEIHYFDYISPKMSKHLWLYEGVIEYASQHVQVKHDLIPMEKFMSVLSEKIVVSKQFNDSIPFTEMSANCLKDGYKKQYDNVYYKGALIGLCLDLKLILASQGQYDLRRLLRDLSREYGVSEPFKDENLFAKIEELTYPEIREFFRDHVEGNKPLPLKELLAEAGMEYAEKAMVKDISPLGGLENGVVKANEDNRFYVDNASLLDEFGKVDIGFKQDDILLSWNDRDLKINTVSVIFSGYLSTVKAGDDLKIEVLRDGKKVTLATTLKKIDMEKEHVIKIRPKTLISTEKINVRLSWLGEVARDY